MATAAVAGRQITSARRAGWVTKFTTARGGWFAVAAVLAMAAALRLIPWLARYPLHHDEALYGAWARAIASGQDPFLLTPWVDKPPLSLYLIAASFKLFGISELTLRLPGMLAGLLTIWASYGLARQMPRRAGIEPSGGLVHGARNGPAPENAGVRPETQIGQGEFSEPQTALFAAALLALSPFAVLFAPTAFTDPWLTLWLVAAAWAALAERPLLAGLAAGLAVASKQQGVLAIPLVLALLLGRNLSVRRTLHQVALAALGFALAFGPLTWWDSLRWHNRPSFWERSLDTYGGLGLAAPAAWPGRAVAWAKPLGYLFGTPAASALVLGLAAMGGMTRVQPARILGLYIIGYLLLHLAITFQPWDRYLLPILPLICVLAAQGWRRGVAWLRGRNEDARCATSKIILGATGNWARILAAIALAALSAYTAWLGAAGHIPVGSDYGAYRGVDRAAAALAALPPDTVIYYRSLGWHLDFYLFNAPQERRWYDTADKLADEAAATARARPTRPQWLVLPAWETPDAAALQAPLTAQGLGLMERAGVALPDGQRAFTLYQIAPITAGEGP